MVHRQNSMDDVQSASLPITLQVGLVVQPNPPWMHRSGHWLTSIISHTCRHCWSAKKH
jgi:hypothetical protein